MGRQRLTLIRNQSSGAKKGDPEAARAALDGPSFADALFTMGNLLSSVFP